MFRKTDTLKIKGIAIAMLLFHHLFFSADRMLNNDIQFMFLSQNKVQLLAVLCRICVWIFVFLSAYGLTYKYIHTKDNPFRFVLKAIISLMKQFWLIYLVILFVYLLFQKGSLGIYQNNIIYMVINFFGLSDFFHTPTILGAWWYITLAILLIVLIPFISDSCRKYGWLVLLFSYIIIQLLNPSLGSSYGGNYFNYFPTMICGVLCAIYQILDRWKTNDWGGGRQNNCFLDFCSNYCISITVVKRKY